MPASCGSRLSRFRPRRLGLRARITLSFAVGALALSVLLAGTTYLVVRQTILRQREASVLRQTYVNARVMRDSLRSADPEVPQLLTSLQTPAGSFPLVLFGDRWFPLTLEYGRDALPSDLRERVAQGSAARMRYSLRGDTVLAVGVPLVGMNASYFEIVSLGELQNTLRSIRLAADRRGAAHHTARRAARRVGEQTRGSPARATRPKPRKPSPPATSTHASMSRTTATSRASRRLSTRWSPRCSTASSVTLASHPTSATSSGHHS